MVVEGDAGGQAEEALKRSFTQPGEGARPVALEREQVFAGLKDRLDALADRGQMRSPAGLVAAAWAHDGGVQFADPVSEVTSGIALVAEQRLAATALAAREQPKADLALVALGRRELKRPRRAVRRDHRVQAKSPEVPGVRGAPPVVGGVTQRRAPVASLGAPGRSGRRRPR